MQEESKMTLYIFYAKQYKHGHMAAHIHARTLTAINVHTIFQNAFKGFI